jgi:probable phosphoglycerate mutase
MLTQVPYFFLRHGATDWNEGGLTQGRTDVALNADGLAQAELAGRALAGHGVTAIFASTLGRARRTAEIVGAAVGISVTFDPDLQEATFGEQEGKPMGPWYNDWVAGTYTPAGGETFVDLCARVLPAVNRASANPGPVLVVGHGAMFRAVRAAMGLSPLVRTDNGVPLRCVPGEPWDVSIVVPA